MHSRITFCIPSKNKVEFLPACIQSVLNQRSANWNCVIVDSSTDGSWEYLQKFASDSRFKLLRGLDRGMYADWNYCIQNVQTEYFVVLPSDDVCTPDLSTYSVELLDQHREVDLCHSTLDLIDEYGRCIKSWAQINSSNPWREHLDYRQLRKRPLDSISQIAGLSSFVNSLTLVCRRRLFENIGGYSDSWGSCGDVDWYIRSTMRSDVIYCPLKAGSWRMTKGQATFSYSELENLKNLYTLKNDNLNQACDFGFSQEQAALLKSRISYLITAEYERLLSRAIVSAHLRRPQGSSIARPKLQGFTQVRWLRLIEYLYLKYTKKLHADKDKFASWLVSSALVEWPPTRI